MRPKGFNNPYPSEVGFEHLTEAHFEAGADAMLEKKNPNSAQVEGHFETDIQGKGYLVFIEEKDD